MMQILAWLRIARLINDRYRSSSGVAISQRYALAIARSLGLMDWNQPEIVSLSWVPV